MALVSTFQLSPDERPFIGISDLRAVEILARAVSVQFSEAFEKGNPELIRLAREYATGKSVISTVWFSESPAVVTKGN